MEQICTGDIAVNNYICLAKYQYPPLQLILQIGPNRYYLFRMSNPSLTAWLSWQAFQPIDEQKSPKPVRSLDPDNFLPFDLLASPKRRNGFRVNSMGFRSIFSGSFYHIFFTQPSPFRSIHAKAYFRTPLGTSMVIDSATAKPRLPA